MYNIDELSSKNISELEDIAKELGISIDKKSSQQDIVYTILDEQAKIRGRSVDTAYHGYC